MALSIHWVLCLVLVTCVALAATGSDYDDDETRPSMDDLYTSLERMEEGPDTSERKFASKRALAVLSRMRPFGSLGLRTNTLGKVPPRAPMRSMVPDLDFVSAETRATMLRPLGQPLRWGRKR